MSQVNNDNQYQATPEQMLYAKVLEIGMYLGLLLLFVTFAIYVFGIVDPYIPMQNLSTCWSGGVHDYLQNSNVKPGWAWLHMLGYGDFMNFIGIAFLAGVTIICYASIVPTLFKNKDFVYAILALLEVIILSLAASGLLAVGH